MNLNDAARFHFMEAHSFALRFQIRLIFPSAKNYSEYYLHEPLVSQWKNECSPYTTKTYLQGYDIRTPIAFFANMMKHARARKASYS